MSNCIYTHKGKTFSSKEKLLSYLNRGVEDTSYKNTEVWNYLTEMTDEETATKIYVANNYNLPSMTEAMELVKEIMEFSVIDGYDYYKYMFNTTLGTTLEEDDVVTVSIDIGKEYANELINRMNNVYVELSEARRRKDYVEQKRLRAVLNILKDRIEEAQKIYSIRQFIAQFEKDKETLDELYNGSITFKQLMEGKAIISFWKNAYNSLIKDYTNYADKLRNEFIEIETQLEPYIAVLDNAQLKLIEEFVGTKINDPTFDLEKYLKMVKDTNVLSGQFLTMSEQNFLLLQALHKEYKEEMLKATTDSLKVAKRIDEVTQPAIEAIKALGYNSFREVFEQKWEGSPTGNIVTPYTYNYYYDKKEVFEYALKTRSRKAWKNYAKWRRDNEILLDVRILFPDNDLYPTHVNYTDADREVYIEKIKEELPGEDVDALIEQARIQVENFKKEFEDLKEYLDNDEFYRDNEEWKQRELYEYLIARSPYVYADIIIDDVEFRNEFTKDKMYNEGYVYSITVPKKMRRRKIGNKEDLVETGYYDSNFDVIKQNPALYEFWKTFIEIRDTMNEKLPANVAKRMSHDEIPYERKTLREVFSENGIKSGVGKVVSEIPQAFTINDTSDLDYVNTDLGGEEINKLKIRMVRDDKYFYQKIEKYLDAGISRDTAYKMVLKEMSDNQSFDLPILLKKYAELTLMYEAKRRVEPILIATENVLNNTKETKFKDTGSIIKKPSNRVDQISEVESFKQYKEILKGFKLNFYDKATRHYGRIKQVKVKDKKTKEEIENKQKLIEKLKEEIEDTRAKMNDKISNTISNRMKQRIKDRYESKIAEYERKIEEIEDEIKNMGSAVVATKFLEVGMKYFHVKSLGWNLPSFVANLGFGYINNMTEASAGQVYDFDSYMTAVQYGMASIANNMTFNQYKKLGDRVPGANLAHKIRAIMDNWEILRSAKTELGRSDFNKKFNDATRWLLPYNLTERAEYINQSNVLVAMMLFKKYNVNGKQVSLFDMFDDNGELKKEYEDVVSDKEIIDFRLAVEQTIMRLHGNYDKFSPIKIESTIFGKMIIMFRRWMFSGINWRYERERTDLMLNKKVKGRFVSLYDFVLRDNGYRLKFMTIPANITLLFAEFAKAYATRLANIGRKIAGKETKKTFTHLDELDAQNMRRLLTELQWWVSLAMLTTVIKGMIDDEKEEETSEDKAANRGPMSIFSKRSLMYFILNIGHRMSTDITFYMNFNSFTTIIRDPVPMQRLSEDIENFETALIKYFDGEVYYKTGLYAGQHRLAIRAANLLPLGSTYPRLYSFTHKEVVKEDIWDILYRKTRKGDNKNKNQNYFFYEE